MIILPPTSTLFPYTTLFRSLRATLRAKAARGGQRRLPREPAGAGRALSGNGRAERGDRKSTRLNSSHGSSSYAVFCLKKKLKSPLHHDNSVGSPEFANLGAS